MPHEGIMTVLTGHAAWQHGGPPHVISRPSTWLRRQRHRCQTPAVALYLWCQYNRKCMLSGCSLFCCCFFGSNSPICEKEVSFNWFPAHALLARNFSISRSYKFKIRRLPAQSIDIKICTTLPHLVPTGGTWDFAEFWQAQHQFHCQ